MKLKWWHFVLFIALFLVLVSPLASGSPDGLEKVAEDKGFIEETTEPLYELIADYALPGVESEALATILAGLIGTLAVFGLIYSTAWLLRRKQASKSQEMISAPDSD
jgi:ABC-type Fe3+ transport system permease subunit